MGQIRVLDTGVANLIAAGEVVDRPASVVKELMENSIDAKSTLITVEIKRGGVSFIRITDDGCGMSHDDVPIAIQSHATSKIKCAEDLDAILTLGFRGEALASIAAVSKLRIMTKRKEDETGSFLISEQGIIKEVGAANTPNGTTIIIEELFFNVPARRKFLKSDMAESMAISAVVEKIALSHPEISVRLIIDNNVKFSTSGDGKLQNTIYAVLGRDFAMRLISINHKTDAISLDGYIGSPDQVKSNRNAQNFFINGRYIKSRTATAALEQAFHSYIPSDKFPCCVLNMHLHPALVDVNVHPAKLEVKFSNERMVFDAIYSAVRSAILQGIDRPKLKFGDSTRLSSDDMKVTNAFVPIYDKMNKDAPDEELLTQIKMQDIAPQKEAQAAIVSSVSQPQIVKEKEEQTFADLSVPKETKPSFSNPLDDLPFDALSVMTTQEVSKDTKSNTTNEKPSILLTKDVTRPRVLVPEYQILGIAFHSYIFVEVDEKVLVIDKHAAHERILFERMKEIMAANDKEKATQILFVPLNISISKEDRAVAIDFQTEIEALGFLYQIKAQTIEITEYPSMLTAEQAVELFQQFLTCMQNGTGELHLQREILCEKALYQSSCKAAMKAGRNDGPEHIKWICDELLSLPDIKYCPHGRPVAFELTRQDLEHQFKRT